MRFSKNSFVLVVAVSALFFSLSFGAASQAQKDLEGDKKTEKIDFSVLQSQIIEQAKIDYEANKDEYGRMEEHARAEEKQRAYRESQITSLTLTPKATQIKICGVDFQRIDLEVPTEALSAFKIEYKNISVGDGKYGTDYTFRVPDSVSLSLDSAARVNNAKIERMPEIAASIPLMPDIPMFPTAGDSPELCSWIKDYISAYKETNSTLSSGLFRFDVAQGQLRATSAASEAKIHPLDTPQGPSIADPSTPGLKYLILTHREYVSEAEWLADYRNSQGITTEVQVLEDLPGYDANGPTPPECTGLYEHECYFYPGQDRIVNEYDEDEEVVTASAAATMEEMVKPPTPAMASRLVDKRGIIRAAIRRTKTEHPTLKAVMLMGDQDMLPYSAFESGISGRSWQEIASNSTGDQSPNGSAGTDAFYSAAFIPLYGYVQYQVPQPLVAGASYTATYVMPTGPIKRFVSAGRPFLPLYQCHDSSGQVSYRQWCLAGETPTPGFGKDSLIQPMRTAFSSKPSVHPYRGYGGKLADCCGSITNPDKNYNLYLSNGGSVNLQVPASYKAWTSIDPATQLVVVARLKTYSRWYGHDPMPANYIAKLISWENNLPPFLNNSLYTLGGEDANFITAANMSAVHSKFRAYYGPSSKMYLSDFYLQHPAANLAAACPQCQHKSANDILTEMSTRNWTSWFPMGHGGYQGFQVAPTTPGEKSGYLVQDSYGINPSGHLMSLEDADTMTLKKLADSNALIGHVVAVSCETNLINDRTYSSDVLQSIDPFTNVRNISDSLISMPHAGAINTYMSNRLATMGGGTSMALMFQEYVKKAWQSCGRIGDAVIPMIREIKGLDNVNVFNGDPFAMIAAKPARCIIEHRIESRN